MESTILYNCFAQLADAGCHIEKNIEDGDGGSDADVDSNSGSSTGDSSPGDVDGGGHD